MNDYVKRGGSAARPGDVPPGGAPVPGGALPARDAAEARRWDELRARCKTPDAARVALGALGIGFLFCETILFSSPGISVPAVMALYGLLLRRAFRDRPVPRAAKGMALPIGLLALSFLLHDNPSTSWIGMGCMLLLCALQLVVLSGGEHPFDAAALLEVPRRIVGRPLADIGLPFAALSALRGARSKTVRKAAAAGLGVLLALPVGMVLLALFSSADAAFSGALGKLFDVLRLRPAALFADAVLGGFLGLMLGACLLRISRAEREAPRTPGACLPGALSGSFLCVIDAVTLLFVGFQFYYLFGGESGRAALGLTYSQYARQGFFELCAASALVFASALGALLLTGDRENRPVRALAALLCLGDMVILASALKRMALYVSAYGLSVRRLLALWGMAVVAACLCCLLARCAVTRVRVLRLIGTAAVAGVCMLGLMNTERLVGGWNARRMASGAIPLDAGVFEELGCTAAPQVRLLLEMAPQTDGELEEVRLVLDRMREQLGRRPPIYGFSLDRFASERAVGTAFPQGGTGGGPTAA